MATRTVNYKYKAIFESIVWLFENGFIKNVPIRSVDGNVIRTAEDVFVLSDDRDVPSESGGRFAFDSHGASWFAHLRGEYGSGDAGAWKNLIDLVAQDYHHNYSFLTYQRKLDEAQRQNDDALAQRFCTEVLRPLYSSKPFQFEAARDNEVEICGLALRLTANYGVGESQPFLGTVFFRKEGGYFHPIPKEEGAQIKEIISRTPDDAKDESVVDNSVDHTKLWDGVFAAMTACVEEENDNGDNAFTDYVIFSKEDLDILEDKRREFSPNGPLVLDCSEIKVLGFSSIKWQASRYNVMLGGKAVLCVTIGLNNSVDVSCLNCHSKDHLVRSNRIASAVSDEGWILQPDKKNFGLTASDIKQIAEQSEFCKHLFLVDCSANTLDGCVRTACATQVEEADGRRICRGCRRPEVYYTDIFHPEQKGGLTADLEFAFDKMRLTSEATFECPCCHKRYTKNNSGQLSNLCPNCSQPDATPLGAKNYKYYRKLLSPAVRLTHAFVKSKSCKEYNGLLIFHLGKDVYVFDRVKALGNGLIRGPVKYRRSK